MAKKVKVAIIGLGFGADFIPIYQKHPDAELYAICRRNKQELDKCGEKYNVDRRFTNYKDILKIGEVDAIHVVTPVSTHAEIVLDCLNAGKHVASTVPMATSIDDCKKIVKTRRKVDKIYMMMETSAYTREFLYVKNLIDSGKLGKIQFLRGSHLQDMEDWGEPWPGFPPMHYATHAVSPLAVLANADIDSVYCLGSGRIREEYIKEYNSPFAIESTLLKFRDSDLAGEITRSLYDTVRQYIESFDVYGKKLSFEWNRLESENPILHLGKEDAKRVEIPDTGHMLPDEVAQFTKSEEVMDDEEKQHLSFIQGSGHGGSHPHMVHEFVRAIIEDRDSAIDAEKAANWTCTGLCAHMSAMKGGEKIYLPDFYNL
ncbi:MAG: Gfo/Idh/MocA family protein [Actinomycetota bacterium]